MMACYRSDRRRILEYQNYFQINRKDLGKDISGAISEIESVKWQTETDAKNIKID